MQSSNLAHFYPWIFVIKNVDLVHSIRKGSWMPWSVQLVSIPELEISSIQKLSFLKIGFHSQQFFSTLSVWDLWIHRHTHLPTHMHTSTPTHPHTRTHKHTHSHTGMHTHTCTHMYTHTHTHAHTCRHTHSHTCTHTHAHTLMHTHTHTHTHTLFACFYS